MTKKLLTNTKNKVNISLYWIVFYMALIIKVIYLAQCVIKMAFLMIFFGSAKNVGGRCRRQAKKHHGY
ncbi:hypothetical protein [Methylovulum psychrotolerans]|uniref:hypothetical protein n=1 Tax=Methylovulum psychrotolerans TaxID=1704499 RepID=UPI001B808875|nr:hypothetical protein [Methylovulum psychrotolerans]